MDTVYTIKKSPNEVRLIDARLRLTEKLNFLVGLILFFLLIVLLFTAGTLWTMFETLAAFSEAMQ